MKHFFAMFIAILCLFSQIWSVDIDMPDDEPPEITAVVRSCDYGEGPGQDWGFTYHDYDYRYPPTYQKPLDFDYYGLTQDDVISILENPSQWRKFWFRIDISPAWEDLHYSDIAKFVGIQYDVDSATNKNMFIRNVETHMYYRNPIRLHPKPHIFVNGLDSFLDYHKVPLDMRGEEKRTTNTRQWIMEALFYVGEMSEEDIIESLENTWLTFDVLFFQSNRLYAQNVSVDLSKVPRDIHYREGGIQPYGKTYTRFFEDLVALPQNEILLFTQIPVDVFKDATDHPENYAWYELDVHYKKDMPWGICSVRLLSKTPEADTDCWVYHLAALDDDLYWSNNDKWENGEWALYRNAILMRIDGDTDQEIENRIRDMELVMEFSTDFAGLIYWGEYEPEREGYPGMRFSVDVDMSRIKENVAANEER